MPELSFEEPMMVKCQMFSSNTKSWDELMAEAADFATQVGKDRLINIAVSEAGGVDIGGVGAKGSVFVWYWE